MVRLNPFTAVIQSSVALPVSLSDVAAVVGVACPPEAGRRLAFDADWHETPLDRAVELVGSAGSDPLMDHLLLSWLQQSRQAVPITLVGLVGLPASEGNAESAASPGVRRALPGLLNRWLSDYKRGGIDGFVAAAFPDGGTEAMAAQRAEAPALALRLLEAKVRLDLSEPSAAAEVERVRGSVLGDRTLALGHLEWMPRPSDRWREDRPIPPQAADAWRPLLDAAAAALRGGDMSLPRLAALWRRVAARAVGRRPGAAP